MADNFYYDRESGKWTTGTAPLEQPPTEVPVEPLPDTPTVTQQSNKGDNFSGTQEDFLKLANSKEEETEILTGSDRPWAVVPNPDGKMSLSLHFIITRIIEGYGYEVFGLPEKWREIIFTLENPLTQDESDWGLFVRVCEKYGYRIKRDEGGRVFTFVPESEGLNTLANYRVAFHSFGGRVYPLNFLDTPADEYPIFIIKSGFSINVSSNGTFIPQVKHFIDDEGKAKVVVTVPEALSEFLTNDYEFNQEFFDDQATKYREGVLEGEEKRLFESVTKAGQNPSIADITRFFSYASPDSNSNDTQDVGYQIYRYEGWESGFTTHGNKYTTPGDWLMIEGTSANLYFPFQVKGVTHRFGHKWTTDYEMIR